MRRCRPNPQGRLFADWPHPQAWLASLPEDECRDPRHFPRVYRPISWRIRSRDRTKGLHPPVSGWASLGWVIDYQQGKALVLALLLGPRFFEDPLRSGRVFHPRRHCQAWQAVTGVPKIA